MSKSEMKEKIDVIIKLRPINKKELLQNEQSEEPRDEEDLSCVEYREVGKKWEFKIKQPGTKHVYPYAFKKVLGPDTDQKQTFHRVMKKRLRNFLERGVNCTLFAYGQSGSGKTYTFFGKEPDMWGPEYEVPHPRLPDRMIKKRDRKPEEAIEPVDPKAYGLIPNSLVYVFNWLAQEAEYLKHVRVQVGFYEIYTNGLYDLLDPLEVPWKCNYCRFVNKVNHKSCKECGADKTIMRQPLEPMDTGKNFYIFKVGGFDKWKAERKEFEKEARKKFPRDNRAANQLKYNLSKQALVKHVQKRVEVQNVEDFFKVFVRAQYLRTVKPTQFNPFSSRGHCVITIYLSLEYKKGHPRAKDGIIEPLLTFADLAGSERISKEQSGVGLTPNEWTALYRESEAINISLGHLSNVISKLSKRTGKNDPLPPFNSSLLTKCLQKALEGKGASAPELSVICAASPFYKHFGPTRNTLNFGDKCMKIKRVKSGKQKRLNLPQALDRIVELEKLVAELEKASGLGSKPLAPGIVIPSNVMFDGDEDEYRDGVKETTLAIRKYIKKNENDLKEVGITKDLKFRVHLTTYTYDDDDAQKTGIYFLDDSLTEEQVDNLRNSFIDNVVPGLISQGLKQFKAVEDIIMDDPLDMSSAEEKINELESQNSDLNRQVQSLEVSIASLTEDLEKAQNEPKSGDGLSLPECEELKHGVKYEMTPNEVDTAAHSFLANVAEHPHGKIPLVEQSMDLIRILAIRLEEEIRKAEQLARDNQSIQEDTKQMAREMTKANMLFPKGMSKHFSDFSAPASNIVQNYKLAEDHQESSALLWEKLSKKSRYGDFHNLVSTYTDAIDKLREELYSETGERLLTAEEQEERLAAIFAPNAINNRDLFDDDDDPYANMMNASTEVADYQTSSPWNKYLLEFSPLEIQLLQEFKNIDDLSTILIDNAFASEGTLSSYLNFQEFSTALIKNNYLTNKSLISKIFSILDVQKTGQIQMGLVLEFVEAVGTYVLAERIHADVRLHVDYKTMFDENSEDSRLTMRGAKKIIAEFRGVSLSEIRDFDLGVQFLENMTLPQLEQLLINCPVEAWDVLTKFHKFEALICDLEQRQRVDPYLGLATFDQFFQTFVETEVFPDDSNSRNLVKEAVLEIGLATGLPQGFPYMLAYNLLCGPTQNVIDFSQISLEKTSKPYMERNRLVPLEKTLKALNEQTQKLIKDSENNQLIQEQLQDLERQKEDLENQLQFQQKQNEQQMEKFKCLEEQQKSQTEAQIGALRDEIVQLEKVADAAGEMSKRDRNRHDQLEERVKVLTDMSVQIARKRREQDSYIKKLEATGRLTDKQLQRKREQQAEELGELRQELQGVLDDKDNMTQRELQAITELESVRKQAEAELKAAQKELENNVHLYKDADAAYAHFLQVEQVKKWIKRGRPQNAQMEALEKQLELTDFEPPKPKSFRRVTVGNNYWESCPNAIQISNASRRKVNGTYFKKPKLFNDRVYYEKTPDAKDSWVIRWEPEATAWLINDKRAKMHGLTCVAYCSDDAPHPADVRAAWAVYNKKTKDFPSEYAMEAKAKDVRSTKVEDNSHANLIGDYLSINDYQSLN